VATDSCSSLPGAACLWLEVAWPVVVLATALPAPVLIVRRARWRVVWICLGGWPGHERLLLYQLAPIVVAGV